MKMQKDSSGCPITKVEGEKRAKWFNENNQLVIPEEYLLQIGLYLYLRNWTKGTLAVAFLKNEDYLHPELFDIANREIKVEAVNINLEKFKAYVDYASNWYKMHITAGESPTMTKEDHEWLKRELKYLE
jgi:hypothetical protein